MDEKRFFKAVKDGDIETVRTLLAEDPGHVNLVDKEHNTPLHWAAWRGQPLVAEVLIDAGASINGHSQNDHWGTTPLHAAAHGNQKEVAEVLIRRGADVNAHRAVGVGTPLAETRIHKATAVAKLLREAGANE